MWKTCKKRKIEIKGIFIKCCLIIWQKFKKKFLKIEKCKKYVNKEKTWLNQRNVRRMHKISMIRQNIMKKD